MKNIRTLCNRNAMFWFVNMKQRINDLKINRNNLLKQSVENAFKGYLNICRQSKASFGQNYQHIIMQQGITPPVPGLVYRPNFISQQNIQQLIKNCQALYSVLQQKYQQKQNMHQSFNHNLQSTKHYKLLHIEDPSREDHGKIDAQMFKNYGSQLHDLVYFIDNKNIPKFVKDDLVRRLQQIPQVVQVQNSKTGLQKHEELNWRLTYNIYKANNHEQAFMWHKDIPVNGTITSITSVLGSGYFQIKHQNPENEKFTYKLKLGAGSLVVLTGQSRWKWIHRVTRNNNKQIKQPKSITDIQRISLVLGCK